jgi:hypothetical protein
MTKPTYRKKTVMNFKNVSIIVFTLGITIWIIVSVFFLNACVIRLAPEYTPGIVPDDAANSDELDYYDSGVGQDAFPDQDIQTVIIK